MKLLRRVNPDWIIATCAAIVVFAVVTMLYIEIKNDQELTGIAKTNRRALMVLEDATGEEARTRNASNLTKAITLLDCRGQENLQRLALYVAARDKTPVVPTVITPQCQQFLLENPQP